MSVPLMKYWSISSIILTEEAKELWLEVEIISKDKNLFYIKWEWKEILFKSTDFWWNSSLWLKIANDKELTYKILEKYNLPIAKTWYISPEEIDNVEKLSIVFPVIIKPLEEWHGNWVMMNILNISELKSKLEESFKVYNKMIIQKQIEWKEYRIIFFKWKIIRAYSRIPPYIIWNWTSTINDLILTENKENILRWEWYNTTLSYIKIDNELNTFIEKQWLLMTYILEKWKRIEVRSNSNVWSGWTVIDVVEKIHPDIIKTCINLFNIFKLKFSWIDIITNDITKSLSETGWIILEINATPWVWWRKSGKLLLESLFFNK